MRRPTFILIGIVLVGLAILAGRFYWQNLRGIWPAARPPATPSRETDSPSPISAVQNTTGLPLTLQAGFKIETFAKNLPGARVMVFDTFGNLWVSQTSQGIISLLEIRDSKVMRQSAVFRDLHKPHGLAFDPDNEFSLYIAEEDAISRVGVYSEGNPEKIADLPSGAGHFTRTLGFGPDGRLYVSIGSSCNVCNEEDDRRAKIFSMEADGSDFKEFARGLRNAVFFMWHEVTKKMWATEMGRDLLGDNIPPDEIDIIEEGKNYGWPNCYGKNIHDAQFDKNTYIRNPCMEPFEAPSSIDIPAHSAPLGLAFIGDSRWPKDYRGDLLVAYHGSWNRSAPTGYKIVRFNLDRNGVVEGDQEDFIAGWLPATGGGQVYGRPVDLVFGRDGALYISDDKTGVIYRVTYSAAQL